PPCPHSRPLPYTTLFRSILDERHLLEPPQDATTRHKRRAHPTTPPAGWQMKYPCRPRSAGDHVQELSPPGPQTNHDPTPDFSPRDRKSTRLNSSHVKISY